MLLGEPVPVSLADYKVLDRQGCEIIVGSLWAGGSTLLIFLRPFGCSCCNEQISELAPRLEELHELGVRTVLVGSGDPHIIDRVVERFALSGKKVEIVTDPGLAAFKAAGLRRSFWATYGPLAIWDMIRAIGHGHFSHLGEGDALQQGGALLIDADGKLAWCHKSISRGGHAPSVEIVEAAMRLVLKQAASSP